MQLVNTNVIKTGAVQANSIRNLICLSHLRWDFVFQRPQHLLTRFAKNISVFYVEEPIADAENQDHYTYSNREDNLIVMVPHIRPGLSVQDANAAMRALFDGFMKNKNLDECAFWYYTPMALEFSRKYNPASTIFDCMDELSAFKFAPQELKNLEAELLKRADVVFTGGVSLYEAKKNRHTNIFPFPSTIDKAHFKKARKIGISPANQTDTTKPTIGFYGVLDERFDAQLIGHIAEARPDWQIILIGPVVKINPDTLPKNPNIHYLGAKTYQQLPQYLASWDIALIPYLLNESTRFISPTKTPEYLAAGKPVISTPIKDVINPYGIKQLVHICATADDFIDAIEKELKIKNKDKWLRQVDAFLELNSWDKTQQAMAGIIDENLNKKAFAYIAQ